MCVIYLNCLFVGSLRGSFISVHSYYGSRREIGLNHIRGLLKIFVTSALVEILFFLVAKTQRTIASHGIATSFSENKR